MTLSVDPPASNQQNCSQIQQNDGHQLYHRYTIYISQNFYFILDLMSKTGRKSAGWCWDELTSFKYIDYKGINKVCVQIAWNSIIRNANSEFSASLASFSWHSSNLSKKIAPHTKHEKSFLAGFQFSWGYFSASKSSSLT